MVTYGKNLAGGCPGRGLRPQGPDAPLPRKIAPSNCRFARGTFNSHPYVMTAMDEFLTPTRRSRVPFGL